MNDRTRHAAATPVANDVAIREPEVFVDPGFTNGDTTLSDAEIAFFKEHGFLVKRGFLDERETFARVVDCVWENIPHGLFRRDDPGTWVRAPDQWTDEDEARYGQFRGRSWKLRSRDGIGTEPFFLNGIGNHPRMRELVSLFIGEPVKRLKRVRGVYVQLPVEPGSAGTLSPHSDHTAGGLNAMVVVDEVPPSCGGFTIWPGTHTRLHPYWETVESGAIPDERAKAYAEARDAAVRDIAPLEFPGRAGDVIFWHPRLLHSAGINRSAEQGAPVLRLIVPCDYQRDGRDFFDDLVHGPGPNHQWWVDTRHFHGDVPTTADNVWHGWTFRNR